MPSELMPEGTRRLKLVLSALSVGAIVACYIVVLVVYGSPYWKGWWVVMGLILLLAFVASRLAARLFEWVFAGYRV